MPKTEYETLQTAIGYRFKDLAHLTRALTHSSYSNVHGGKSYERYEFLGDGILGFAVAEYFFETYPEADQGKLTDFRKRVVSKESLCALSKELGLPEFLRYENRPQELSEKVISDLFESIIAAIYLDCGSFQTAKDWILKVCANTLRMAAEGGDHDYITQLNEIEGKRGWKVDYLCEECKEGEKGFHCKLLINGDVWAESFGKSKKEAKERAAKQAMTELENSGR